MFILKLDTFGQFLCAGGVSGNWTYSEGSGLALSRANDVYVCGSIKGNEDFDMGPLVFSLNTSAGNTNAYLSKYTLSSCMLTTNSAYDDKPNSWLISPNPANDFIVFKRIHYSDSFCVIVSNVLGEELDRFSVENKSESYSYDMRRYSNGIYFVKIFQPSGFVSYKIIKE